MEGFGGTGGLLLPPDTAGSVGIWLGCWSLSKGPLAGGGGGDARVGETGPEVG